MKLNTGVMALLFSVFHGAAYGSRKAVSAHNLWLDSFHALVDLSMTRDHRFVHEHILKQMNSVLVSLLSLHHSRLKFPGKGIVSLIDAISPAPAG